MRARIAVHAHLGDPRLEQVEAQHADLEQGIVDLDLRTRVAVAFVLRKQSGRDGSRACVRHGLAELLAVDREERGSVVDGGAAHDDGYERGRGGKYGRRD